tara:strand:+ start:887 stop:1135 length:249 start_codon:yes stop_codon:yes gene_type:complete
MEHTQVSLCFTCFCNNKNYSSQLSLKNHQKTKGHKQWEERNELKLLKIDLTDKDNQIVKLQNDVVNLKELNNLLLRRFQIEQ